jgi:anti-sigma factor RsiW
MGHEREENNELGCGDLGWLAFRYVAGELSPDEQAAFEARLDTDQLVREAVAREVELAQAVAIAAGSLTPVGAVVTPAAQADARPVRFALSARSIGWMVVGAAASLAIGLLIGSGWNADQPLKLAKDTRRAAVEELAGYWHPIEADSDSSDEPAAREAQVATEDADNELAADDGVPTWLLAALEPEESGNSPRREN